MTEPNRTRTRRRRWLLALAILVLLPVLAAALLPAWLNSRSGRRWLLARADRVLAPGRLEVGSFRFSWFGPTRLESVALVDRERRHVIDATRARCDRTLWQLLFDRPRFGTLRLEGAAFDVERKADGTINLYETLRPLFRGDPRLDLTIVSDRARLRFQSAGLPEPIAAERADVMLHLAAAPRPFTWRLALAQPGRAATLAVEGSYERWAPGPSGDRNLELHVDADAWPWAMEAAGLQARGRLHGAFALKRTAQRWATTADGRLTDLEATGPRLAGDRLRLPEVKGAWDIAESPAGWDVRRLDVASAVATLRASGTPTGNGRIDGRVDLAALAQQLPHALGLRAGVVIEQGSAALAIQGRREADQQLWTAEARVSDLHARDSKRGRDFTLKTPVTLSAEVARRGESLSVNRFALACDFLTVEGHGSLDRGLELGGTVDLKALQEQLADLVDFGRVRLAGRGPIRAHYQRTGPRYEGSVDAALKDLRVEGVGPANLERDSAALVLAFQGAATASGLPASWTSVRAELKSGHVAAELTGQSDGDSTAWNARAHAPWRIGGRAHEARAVFAARASGANIALDKVELAVRGDAGDLASLSAKGAFSRADGVLTLEPVAANAGPQALGLAEQGLRVQGLGAGGPLRVELALAGDVAALARLVGAEELNAAGRWSGRLSAHSEDDGLKLAALVEARDLSEDIEGTVSLALDALVPKQSSAIEFGQLRLASPYAIVESAGRIRNDEGRRSLDFRGTVTPGWEALNRLAARRIDPHATLAGKPGTLRLEADVTEPDWDAIRKSLHGEIGFELTRADFFGMRVGATPVALRAAGGKAVILPIDTTINGGRVHLEPDLVMDDERGLALRLGPRSRLDGAEINDEVSHRVLSFVAPVLENATRVHGRVSVALDRAEFPLDRRADRHVEVDGTVTFHDVEFVAGRLVDELMAVIGREPRMSLKLNRPVALVIADGRVQTQGLALPLGNVSEVDFDGWVDFSRQLHMTASLPVTRKMVLDVGFLGDIVEGTKISVPIGGTLDHPRVDRDALKMSMRELGKTLLERTAGRGAAELLMRLARPRDPNAPPRPTPEERRARRRERRMQRNEALPPDR